MILIVHIILAVTSIVQVTHAVFFPTKYKLQIGYLLTLCTVISGFLMGITSPMSIGQVCVRGVIYLGLTITMLVLARKRMNTITQ